jgi:hypothetical protein
VRKPVELVNELIFRYSGGKFLSSEIGDYWNEGKKIIQPHANQHSYDGANSTRFWEGGESLFPSATVTLKADVKENVAFKLVTYYPIWLAYNSIELLKRANYKPDALTVSEGKAHVGKTECIEVLVPGVSGIVGAVYVDPARNYIPIKFVLSHKKRWLEMEMSYAPNPRIGWVLSDWVITLPDPMHDFAVTRACKVKYVSINERLDDKLLTIQYPPGTYISENNGGIRQFFIVQPDGTRKPSNPAEMRAKQAKEPPSASL